METSRRTVSVLLVAAAALMLPACVGRTTPPPQSPATVTSPAEVLQRQNVAAAYCSPHPDAPDGSLLSDPLRTSGGPVWWPYDEAVSCG